MEEFIEKLKQTIVGNPKENYIIDIKYLPEFIVKELYDNIISQLGNELDRFLIIDSKNPLRTIGKLCQ
jgi:hypothetical protein